MKTSTKRTTGRRERESPSIREVREIYWVSRKQASRNKKIGEWEQYQGMEAD